MGLWEQRHSGGEEEGGDAGGREPRGTDGWKRLKERRIVRVEQTGRRKVTAAEKETDG